jgi:hypothetical protein
MTERDPLIEAQRLVSGFRGYQLVVAACRLKLPDLVADEPKTVAELAAETNTHPRSLHRMLRGLAAWGFLLERNDGRYASTPVAELFREDKPGLRNNALMLAEEGYQSWAEMMYTLRTGKPAFEHIFGKSRWEKLAENPAALEQFNAAMVETSTRVARALIASYDFGEVRSVVDVGGGNGGLLAGVLLAHPEMKGVLVDLPQGLVGARERLDAAGLGDRVSIKEGSFFDEVPSGADLYLLKSIVHDWDDERAVEILKTCRTAMHSRARLALVERQLPELIDNPDVALPSVMTDLQMMLVLGGAERTSSEYRHLMAGAALEMNRVIPIGADFCVFEAVIAQV